MEQIRGGSRVAAKTLYEEVQRCATPYLRWRLGETASAELEDRLHNAYLATLQAIRAGAIRNPDRLQSFIYTIVRHQAAMAMRTVAKKRLHFDISDFLQLEYQVPGQEQLLMAAEQSQLLRDLLGAMKPMDRELLARFYLNGQTRETICKEMRLTANQFRLRKSRAKMRLKAMLTSRCAIAVTSRNS